MPDSNTELPIVHADLIVASIDAQLASGQDVIRVGEHGIVHRSYGWAIARSVEAALRAGGTFDTPTLDEHGHWQAHITIDLGRQPT